MRFYVFLVVAKISTPLAKYCWLVVSCCHFQFFFLPNCCHCHFFISPMHLNFISAFLVIKFYHRVLSLFFFLHAITKSVRPSVCVSVPATVFFSFFVVYALWLLVQYFMTKLYFIENPLLLLVRRTTIYYYLP